MPASPKFYETENGVWSDDLQCYVERIEFDLVGCRAVLWLPPRCCVDKRGACDLVESVDKRIDRIYTISGANRDTCYVRHGKQWISTIFADRDERAIGER